MTALSESYNRVCGRERQTHCKRGHLLAETRKVSTSASGRKTYGCLACSALRTQQYTKANPAKYKASARNTKLKAAYGITEEDYQVMLARQHNVCAICFHHQRYQRLAVDHDHKSGKVRGLLCSNCNRGLGHYFDSPQRLRQAAKYLEALSQEETPNAL